MPGDVPDVPEDEPEPPEDEPEPEPTDEPDPETTDEPDPETYDEVKSGFERTMELSEIWQGGGGRARELYEEDPAGFTSRIVEGLWPEIQAEIDAGADRGQMGRAVAQAVSGLLGGQSYEEMLDAAKGDDWIGGNQELWDVLQRLGPDAEQRIDDLLEGPPPERTNSFTADTPVLLADGTTEPIAQIEVGDLVMAADPLTGEAGPRAVTALITGSGAKRLVDVTAGGGTVTATDEHPFWLPDQQRWVDAEDLRVGDDLLTADGRQVPVTALDHRTATLTVHNLTVEDLHTYYTLAGTSPLLVHNADACPPGQEPPPVPQVVTEAFGTPGKVFTRWDAPVFDEFTPGSGFSGVYDPDSRRFSLSPSQENTSLRSGGKVPNRVPRRGGHARVNNAFGRNTGGAFGFTLLLQGDGSLEVNWLSRSVNTRNGHSRDGMVPEERREEIMNAIRRTTGRNVGGQPPPQP